MSKASHKRFSVGVHSPDRLSKFQDSIWNLVAGILPLWLVANPSIPGSRRLLDKAAIKIVSELVLTV